MKNWGGGFVDNPLSFRFLFWPNNRAASNIQLPVARIGERLGGGFVGNREGNL